MSRSLISLSILLVAACDTMNPDSSETVQVERSIDGDTSVVRTLSGSVWGDSVTLQPELTIGELDGAPEYTFGRISSLAVDESGRIYAVDRQVPALRIYDSDGNHVETWGRSGEGPGEFNSPDAGLTILSDGRVVVRNRGNGRLEVFSPEGDPLDTWRVITGQFINRRAFARWGDTILNPDVINPSDPLPEWRLGLVRIAPDGEVVDTLAVPYVGQEAPILVASDGGNLSEAELPFAPGEHWAWHPDGFVVHGVGDGYSFSLLNPEEPVRIEREVAPTPVTSQERAQEEERVTKALQWLDPNWQWDGPPIPNEKPAFSGLYVGGEGRIFVLRDGAAYETEDPDFDPEDPNDVEIRWMQDQSFDVFERDGTFLGSVPLPRDLTFRPPPVLRGDRIWAVTADELGVQRIVRYRIVPSVE